MDCNWQPWFESRMKHEFIWHKEHFSVLCPHVAAENMGLINLQRLIECLLTGAAFAQHPQMIACWRALARHLSLDGLARLALEHAQYMQTMRWSLSPARD
jgi:hypothetical protein